MKTFIQALYQNVGKTIKTLAVWSFIVEAAIAVIAGVVLLFIGLADPGREMMNLIGPLLAVLGAGIAFLLSLFPYCLGEIVDKLCAIERNMREDSVEERVPKVDPYQQSIFKKDQGE